MVEKLSYSGKEELDEEEYSQENDPMFKETDAILGVIGFISRIWFVGGIITGIVNFFKLNWFWGTMSIIIGVTMFFIFTAISIMLQLLYSNYIFMISTHDNIEELSGKMDLKNMFVEVIKKKRR